MEGFNININNIHSDLLKSSVNRADLGVGLAQVWVQVRS